MKEIRSYVLLHWKRPNWVKRIKIFLSKHSDLFINKLFQIVLFMFLFTFIYGLLTLLELFFLRR
jgi:hypothetical protein